MPQPDEHRLERRARRLGEEMVRRVDLVKTFLAPPGHRQPFREALSKPAALAWWRRHRYDSFGQQVLARMSLEDIMELDTAISEMMAADQMGGL